jgi:hypothetical protein
MDGSTEAAALAAEMPATTPMMTKIEPNRNNPTASKPRRRAALLYYFFSTCSSERWLIRNRFSPPSSVGAPMCPSSLATQSTYTGASNGKMPST